MKTPFGIGILYVMANFPFFWWTKIGTTGLFVGTKKRAKQVDRDAPGIPIPVMVIILPFVYQVEQAIHKGFSFLNYEFYKGDGYTEWFWAVAGAAVWWLGIQYWLFIDTLLSEYTGLPPFLHILCDSIFLIAKDILNAYIHG